MQTYFSKLRHRFDLAAADNEFTSFQFAFTGRPTKLVIESDVKTDKW